MREIKFRAWNIKYNVMSYCGEGKYDTDTQGQILDSFDSKYIMQYTGLKDKNGVEVYDGDVVIRKQAPGGILQPMQNSYVCFITRRRGRECIMNEEHCGFTFASEHIEVIGNIYENPGIITKGE